MIVLNEKFLHLEHIQLVTYISGTERGLYTFEGLSYPCIQGILPMSSSFLARLDSAYIETGL